MHGQKNIKLHGEVIFKCLGANDSPIKHDIRVSKFLEPHQRWQEVILIARSYFRVHFLYSWKGPTLRSDK